MKHLTLKEAFQHCDDKIYIVASHPLDSNLMIFEVTPEEFSEFALDLIRKGMIIKCFD